jgi:hypothetical protein
LLHGKENRRETSRRFSSVKIFFSRGHADYLLRRQFGTTQEIT